MKTKGEVIQKFHGSTKGEATILGFLFILLGIFGLFMCFWLESEAHSSEDIEFSILMGMVGVVNLAVGIYLMMKFSKANYAKTYLEICDNGINVLNLNKKELFIAYEDIKAITVSGEKNVSVQNRYESATLLRVADLQTAIQICDAIRENAKRYKGIRL